MAAPPGSDERCPGGVELPPATWRATLRHLGPGLIVTGSIVGSGELIVTTGLGAKAGFILLWLIVLGCLLKLFVQVELGRFAISEGTTTLRAMDGAPGPRARVSWLLWLWGVMFVAVFFQLAGILGAIAQVLRGFGASLSDASIAACIAIATSLLLASGRYSAAEKFATFLVFTFTACTIAAVAAIQWTQHAITGKDLVESVSFRLPSSFVWAFAAFGITGVGASELVYYPYWCAEKGYARFVGPRDGSPAWVERARGWVRVMRIDAWFSLVIYTTSTVAFYFLGAAVLHRTDSGIKNDELLEKLSLMYETTFGAPGLWVYLGGAFFVLYSTFFVATASNARLLADAVWIWSGGRLAPPGRRRGMVRAACIALPLVNLAIFLSIEKSVELILIGALAQAMMLPLLAGLAVHLRHRRTDPSIRPGTAWTMCLWVAFIAIVTVGAYQGWEAIETVLVQGVTP
jgi:Mn2+/Fe2+ NRAMP family transporter